MSGTLGIHPIRWVGVVGLAKVAGSVRARMVMVHRRGGLTTPIAVPVAVALAAAVVWATVVVARLWINA